MYVCVCVCDDTIYYHDTTRLSTVYILSLRRGPRGTRAPHLRTGRINSYRVNDNVTIYIYIIYIHIITPRCLDVVSRSSQYESRGGMAYRKNRQLSRRAGSFCGPLDLYSYERNKKCFCKIEVRNYRQYTSCKKY